MDSKPVQIVTVQDDNFTLNEAVLSNIFENDPDIKNRTIVMVAVAGAYRKGKSFIMNYFLRYLMATVSPTFPS